MREVTLFSNSLTITGSPTPKVIASEEKLKVLPWKTLSHLIALWWAITPSWILMGCCGCLEGNKSRNCHTRYATCHPVRPTSTDETCYSKHLRLLHARPTLFFSQLQVSKKALRVCREVFTFHETSKLVMIRTYVHTCRVQVTHNHLASCSAIKYSVPSTGLHLQLLTKFASMYCS